MIDDKEDCVVSDARHSGRCPECDGQIAHRSGCAECVCCGFAMCSN